MEREVGDEVFSEDEGVYQEEVDQGQDGGGTIEMAQGNRVIRHS